MTLNMSVRGFVRIISFALAAIILMVSYIVISFDEARSYRIKLENTYLRALDDLSSYMNSISGTLSKSMYVGTPQLLGVLSTNLWRESSGAKVSLSALPLGTFNLGETYKFLSQVGDYALSMSRRISNGGTLNEEERNNIKSLTDISKNLRDQIMVIQDGIRGGGINFENAANAEGSDNIVVPTLGDGFEDFQDNLTSYPKLIYDGPFSDHILEKDPEKLKDLQMVSRDQAREKAAQMLNLDVSAIKDASDEEGKMSSYGFQAADANVSITKAGALASYLIKDRAVYEVGISDERAKEISDDYLKRLGVFDVVQTYHEISNNVMTINYAYYKDDIIFYTDLIKVSVALDNGEVLGFDSRGYIMNNKDRGELVPTISEQQARESLSSALKIEKSRLAVVPSDDVNEVLSYEFYCVSDDGNKILVYVNSYTAEEEQVLILLIGENGILTI